MCLPPPSEFYIQNLTTLSKLFKDPNSDYITWADSEVRRLRPFCLVPRQKQPDELRIPLVERPRLAEMAAVIKGRVSAPERVCRVRVDGGSCAIEAGDGSTPQRVKVVVGKRREQAPTLRCAERVAAACLANALPATLAVVAGLLRSPDDARRARVAHRLSPGH